MQAMIAEEDKVGDGVITREEFTNMLQRKVWDEIEKENSDRKKVKKNLPINISYKLRFIGTKLSINFDSIELVLSI